jgi:hypothetical protein
MDYQDNIFEKRAQADINKLKEKYVIDIITAGRLQEIFVYLYLSQASRNQRGINLQTEKLKDVLHNCSRIMPPVFTPQSSNNNVCRV